MDNSSSAFRAAGGVAGPGGAMLLAEHRTRGFQPVVYLIVR